MTSEVTIVDLPLIFGGAVHEVGSSHNVLREHGTRSWLMEYIVAGEVELRSGTDTYRLGEGDLFLFAPRTRQDYSMASQGEHHWVSFLPRPHWHRRLEWPELTQGLACLHVTDPRLRETMLALFREGTELSRLPWRQAADLVMTQTERILLWADTINPAGRDALLDNRIRDALQFMADHHSRRVTLADLAGACCLSPSRFSHLFRSEMQVSPLQYLNSYRMDRAKELLRWTADPIAEVAYRVGFENPLYFSRLFRKLTGRNPRDYRRQR